MSLCIVIPMKDPLQSKQRLSQVLAPNERQCLAINLFQKTLSFLTNNFADIDVMVVTPSQKIAAIAKQYQVAVLMEESAKGLNHAVFCAAQRCIKLGYKSQLVLPADIIELDLTEFTQLLHTSLNHQSVLVCPSQDGGTNALISTPPNAINFSYGQNSADLHFKSAKQHGFDCQQLLLPKLAIDLDTAADLEQLTASHIAQLKSSTTAQRIPFNSTFSNSLLRSDL